MASKASVGKQKDIIESRTSVTTEAETHTMIMMMLFVLNGDNDDREENRENVKLNVTFQHPASITVKHDNKQ